MGALFTTGIQIFGAVLGMQAQGRAEDAQQRLDSLRTQQDRLQQIRAGRIKRAQVEQAGANQGASDSSGVQGGAGAVTTQMNSNIGFINAQEGYGQAISQAKQDEATAQGISDIGSGLQKVDQTAEKAAEIFS